MKLSERIIFLLSIAGLVSCEELEVPSFNRYVVEAFITADEHVYDIKIKETASINATEVQDVPIEDAIVSISDGAESILLDFDSQTGKYYDLKKSLAVVVGQEYFIEIRIDDVLASSQTIVPEKPAGLTLTDSVLIIPQLVLSLDLRDQISDLFDEEIITLNWEGSAGRSYFVVIETQEDSVDAILPLGVPEESKELLESFKFISEPTEDTSFNIIAVALETYGRHVAKVYSVNQEYIDLFNSAAQDSRDLNEPPSNIENALGIFSAFAVDSLEFVVRRE